MTSVIDTALRFLILTIINSLSGDYKRCCKQLLGRADVCGALGTLETAVIAKIALSAERRCLCAYTTFTFGRRLALTVNPTDRGDREQVAALANEVQQVTCGTAKLSYVDQGYTGSDAAEAAEQQGLRLEVVKHPMARRGLVLVPRRGVVERSFAWGARFRRIARDYERLDTTLKSLHLLAFPTFMLRNFAETLK